MTAKEILESMKCENIWQDELTEVEGYIFTKSEIKTFTKQLLKEQRMICASQYAFESPTNDSNNYEIAGEGLKDIVMYEIGNAPEPKLD